MVLQFVEAITRLRLSKTEQFDTPDLIRTTNTFLTQQSTLGISQPSSIHLVSLTLKRNEDAMENSDQTTAQVIDCEDPPSNSNEVRRLIHIELETLKSLLSEEYGFEFYHEMANFEDESDDDYICTHASTEFIMRLKQSKNMSIDVIRTKENAEPKKSFLIEGLLVSPDGHGLGASTTIRFTKFAEDSMSVSVHYHWRKARTSDSETDAVPHGDHQLDIKAR